MIFPHAPHCAVQIVTVLFCLLYSQWAVKGMQVMHNIPAGYKNMQVKLHLHALHTPTLKVNSLPHFKVCVFHLSSASELVGTLNLPI